MEFQFLGTAAFEGIPALWCQCEHCQKSRKIGGRALRTRSQALVNTDLLIDFPADTYCHLLTHGIDMANVHHCLITHNHSDHLYPPDLEALINGYSHLEKGYHITFYGSDKVGAMLRPMIEGILDKDGDGTCDFCEVKAFSAFAAGKYTVTALPAIHDKKSGPLFYQLTDGEKTILYAHDTHYFGEDVWEYWKNNPVYFDFVSLDCTNSCLPVTYVGHMGLEENVRVRERMLAAGLADAQTVFVSNHFSHNGVSVVYDEFLPIAAQHGILTSYDGMCVSV